MKTLQDDQAQLLNTEAAIAIIEWIELNVPSLVEKRTKDLHSNIVEEVKLGLNGAIRASTTNVIGAHLNDHDLHLILERDGKQDVLNLGNVIGKDGRGVERFALENGTLSCLFSDGERTELGQVTGRDGDRIYGFGQASNGELVIKVIDNEDVIVEHGTGIFQPKDGQDGKDGIDGKRGERGLPGKDGAVGRSIQTAFLNEVGNLILDFDDGFRHDVGYVGNGNLASARITKGGTLKLKLTDGKEVTAGPVRGANGRDGSGFIWRGPYRDGATYYGQIDNPDGPLADVVEHQGSSYVATGRTLSTPPQGTWDLLAAKGRDASQVLYMGAGGGPATSVQYDMTDDFPVMRIRRMSVSQYSALTPKDPNTLYAVVPD